MSLKRRDRGLIPSVAGAAARAVTLLALAAPSGAQRLDPKDTVVMLSGTFPKDLEKQKDAVDTYGAGFLLGLRDGRLYIVTANHVAWSNDNDRAKLEAELRPWPGERNPVVAIEPDHWPQKDLALLRIDPDATKKDFSRLAFPKWAAVLKGTKVTVIGQCGGRGWYETSGTVKDVAGATFTIKAEADLQGCSGGGIFSENGCLVGMLKRGDGRESEAVKIEEVLKDARDRGYSVGLLPCDRPPGPPPMRRLSWRPAVSYSRVGIDLTQPRDLRIHANHPDDIPILPPGSDPGETRLERIEADIGEAELGMTYRLGESVALAASYVAKFPLSSGGRAERQQANDSRPPAQGSYIYTKLSKTSLAHALRVGLSFERPLPRGSDWLLQVEGLLDVGRWSLVFEKGWSRFGRDQAETASEARVLCLSPTARVSVGTKGASLFVMAGRPRLILDYDDSRLEGHNATGLALSFGFAFRTGSDSNPR